VRQTPPFTNGTAPGRDLENELYDFGSDLVEAAAGIARRAADANAARAVPALLGCFEASLEELSVAVIGLQRVSCESPRALQTRRPSPDTLDRGYRNLVIALQDARDASHAARSLAARQAEAEPPRRA